MINIFDPVCDDCIWDDKKVKFCDELPLLEGVVLRVPVVPGSPLTLGMHFESRLNQEFARTIREKRVQGDLSSQ